MKKNIFAVMMMLMCSQLFAQQEAMYSQYMFNPFVLNPAVAGSDDDMQLRLGVRRQWTGIENSPFTQNLSFHSALGVEGKTGVGGVLIHDQFGPLSRTGARGAFSYHLNLSEETKLAFGLSVSCYQLVLDESNLNIIDPTDVVINGEKETVLVPDADFGMWLYQDRFFAGFSATQLLQFPLNPANELMKQVPHFYVSGGYRFRLSETMEAEPSLLLKKSNPAPMQFDVNLRAIYDKNYWLGLSYRTDDALSVMLGMKYKQFLIGYAFDYTLSGLSDANSGTHEVVFGIDLKRSPKTSVPQL